MSLPASWKQFVVSESTSTILSFVTLREMVAVGLMLDHLARWFMVHPSETDQLLLQTSNQPPLFATGIGFNTRPVVKSPENNLYYFPKIYWKQTPELTDASTSTLVVRLFSQCDASLQSYIMSLHPEWTWAKYINEPSLILVETVPSLNDFLSVFSNEIDILDKTLEWIQPSDKWMNLYNGLHTQLRSSFSVLPIGLSPPVSIPYGAAQPLLHQLSEKETKLLTTFYQFNYYTSTDLSPEITKSATYAKHLELLDKYFKTRNPKILSGTSTLHQLYKSYYAPEQVPWLEYKNVERDNSPDILIPNRLCEYLVPVPNYNLSCVKPMFSNPSSYTFQSMEWKHRQWFLHCVLGLLVISCRNQPVEMSILLDIKDMNIRETLLHLLCNWFSSYTFYFFGVDTSLASPSNCRIQKEELNISNATKWVQDHPQKMMCVFTSIPEVYDYLSSVDKDTWTVFPMQVNTSTPVHTFWDGDLFYFPWNDLVGTNAFIITQSNKTTAYNSYWLEQHLNWNNVVRRNQIQSRADYPSSINVLWDTVYEYSIIKTYQERLGSNSTRTCVELMKDISIASGQVDKYQQKYCFELGYRPSPVIQKRWHDRIKPTEKKTVPSLVHKLYQQLIFQVPFELKQRWEKLYEKELPQVISKWEMTRKQEIAQICGSYCYDHIKYNLLREWLRSNHLLKEREGVSKEHLEARYSARIREIQSLGSMAKANSDTGFYPRSLLDFGGDKGVVASKMASIYKLSPGSAIVSDVPEWYGHKRERLYNNVTFQTLHSYRLPFEDGQFDTILSLMVLHHIDKVEITCQELRRIMKPGGLLFLREHDCENEDESRLIDIEHSLYELVLSTKTKQDTLEYLANYRAYYRPMKEWTKMLSRVGFQEVNLKYEPAKGYTKYAYRVYEAI